jgi:predicted RNA binding protein YcfA (HicA-like mRNA interferase family)/predicted RNase H-like HicB family nuclease
MTVREVLKELRDDGWFIVRQRGSHRQLHHSTKSGTVTVAGKPSKTLHRKSWLPSGNRHNWSHEMRYWVRLYRQGTDYSAMVPDLPGCVAAGDSVEEVRELIGEAIAMHLEMIEQSGAEIPVPTQHVDLDLTELEEGELSSWVDVPRTRPTRRGRRRVGL